MIVRLGIHNLCDVAGKRVDLSAASYCVRVRVCVRVCVGLECWKIVECRCGTISLDASWRATIGIKIPAYNLIRSVF